MNQIINEKYDLWVSKLHGYIPEEDITDVLNSVLLSLLQRGMTSEEFDCIDCYVLNACKIAYYSKTSPYNRELRRFTIRAEIDELAEMPEDEPEPSFPNVMKLIEESPFCWWEKELFKRKVLEDKTLEEMAAECNISTGKVWYSYNKVRKYLQNKLKEYAEKEEN